MKKKNQISVFVGIFLLLFGVASGIILLQQNTIFRLRANPKAEISKVWITNVSHDSATIVWTATKPTTGFVKWNQTGNELNKIALPTSSTQKSTNSVDLNSLSPSTSYSFSMSVGGVDFFDGDKNWTFKTPQKSIEPASFFIGGQVLSNSNQPIRDGLILVHVSGSSPLSTFSDNEGKWSVNISEAKTQTLTSYIAIDPQKTVLDISVYTANSSSNIKTTPSQAKNINIVLE